MNYRSLAALNRQLVAWLPKLPEDLDLIVGVPRSGLLAANIIALHRGLPLTDIDGFLEGRIFSSGLTKPVKTVSFSPGKRNVLIVDDSLLSGRQMQKVKERIEQARLADRIYYAAVYIAPGREHRVDLFCEALPLPRCFQWNVMHHAALQQCCVDVDGVICRDPAEEENDDGEKYKEFLAKAGPVFVPSMPIGWLVTCRLEKYRALTEKWLAGHHVAYEKLFMMNFPNKTARTASNSHAAYKASVYQKTDAILFIESSLKQSVEIAKLTGREVLCIETGEMIPPPTGSKAMQGCLRIGRKVVRKAKNKLIKFSQVNQMFINNLR